ncbi:MAG TPA: GGDEF domain-containing protein [Kineosporiaceae bacterium]
MSDEIPGHRPVTDDRLLPWLLVVLASTHAAAALVGLGPHPTGMIFALLDVGFAASVFTAVVVSLVPAVAPPPSVAGGGALVAIALAGLLSGARAVEAGTPWAGADVVLAVIAAVSLRSRPVAVAGAGAAALGWGGWVAVGAVDGSVRASASDWALLGVLLTGVAGALAVLHRAHRGMEGALDDAVRSAKQQAVTDSLTGVTNRRGLELTALPMIEHARRQGEAVHCLFIDLDGFRSVNDMLGRSTGDDVLAAVCGALQASVRSTDVVCRWSGDQFVVIGPGTGTSPLEMERRVRHHLAESPPVPRHVWDGRVSIGSATLVPWDEGNVDSLLHRAEEDMRLRRSLRRQSRARAAAAGQPAMEQPSQERRSRPPKRPPASPPVANEH